MKKILFCVAVCALGQGYGVRAADRRDNSPEETLDWVVYYLVRGEAHTAFDYILYLSEKQRQHKQVGDRVLTGRTQEDVAWSFTFPNGQTLLQFAYYIDQNPASAFKIGRGWISGKNNGGWQQVVLSLTPDIHLMLLWSKSGQWEVDGMVQQYLPARWLSMRCLQEKSALELYTYLMKKNYNDLRLDEKKLLHLLSRKMRPQGGGEEATLWYVARDVAQSLPSNFFKSPSKGAE